jgi:hypothetical protein
MNAVSSKHGRRTNDEVLMNDVFLISAMRRIWLRQRIGSSVIN